MPMVRCEASLLQTSGEKLASPGECFALLMLFFISSSCALSYIYAHVVSTLYFSVNPKVFSLQLHPPPSTPAFLTLCRHSSPFPTALVYLI